MGNSFVVADIGASGTRFCSESCVVSELPNNMVFIDNADKIDIEARIGGDNKGSDFKAALDVTIYKTEGHKCEHFPARALVGDIADRYSPTNTRPSVLKNKTSQKVNYISTVLSVAYERLVNGVTPDVDLYIALPPMEVKTQKEQVTQSLVGSYEVIMNKLNGEKITFNIKSVTCVEESFMALLSYFFNVDGKLNDNARKYSTGNVMSFDIGASTTDVCIAKNMKYDEKSGQTFKTGGNVIQAHLSNAIRNRFGYDPTVEELDMVVSTGRLPSGNKFVNMEIELQHAKQEFARSVIEQIQSYFRLVNIPLQTVRAIIVSGGGSIASGYTDETGKFIETCASVSEFITKELKNVVDGIDVVSIDNEARLANVKGMFIKASFDALKKRRAEEASAIKI